MITSNEISKQERNISAEYLIQIIRVIFRYEWNVKFNVKYLQIYMKIN